MSYQVLARKWRPRIFREMVGQEHVLKALINALDRNQLHHAYLFTGTRGVGKTTIARILAKCLNCETGVTSEPCDKCANCVEINEGRFVDLIEVDAASRTKVEDTRDLLDNVPYAPSKGRYKVYLIDEVHMLSGHSFNALLKTLEEPPPHVKFLLATTDPQKLPVTVLSRCLQFNLKNMSPERIVEHLEYILERELIPFETSALWQLARSADGSMRDALSLTDQSIGFGNGKITEADVSSMLGSIDQRHMAEILHALIASDGPQLLSIVGRLAEQSPDYKDALAALISLLHRLAIAQVLPEAVDNTFGDREEVLQLALQLPAEDVQLFYQTAILGRRDLPLSPDPRGGFEMVLLRMLAFKPQGVTDLPTAKLPTKSLPSENVSDKKTATQTSPANPAPALAEELTGAVKKPEAEESDTLHEYDSLPEVRSVEDNTQPQSFESDDLIDFSNDSADDFSSVHVDELQNETQIANIKKFEPQNSSSVERPIEKTIPEPIQKLHAEAVTKPVPQVKSVPEKSVPKKAIVKSFSLDEITPNHWNDLTLQLPIGGVIQNTVVNTQLFARRENLFQLILDQNNSTLYDQSHQQRLADILGDYFQQPISVVIELGEVSVETPAIRASRLREERQAQALESIRTDPNVKNLIATFSGRLNEESVKPVDH